MKQTLSLQHQHRQRDLLRLARTLYESALHEEDAQRLELQRLVAVKVKGLLDETFEQDDLLHVDLGMSLLLFIELKRDGNSEAEAYRKDVEQLFKIIEGTAARGILSGSVRKRR